MSRSCPGRAPTLDGRFARCGGLVRAVEGGLGRMGNCGRCGWTGPLSVHTVAPLKSEPPIPEEIDDELP